MKRKKEPKIPYPHAEFISKLYEQMGERRITEGEARAVLNARVFESIIETWLPELREIAQHPNTSEGAHEFENAQLLIAQAANMAQAIGIELVVAKVEAQRVHAATDAEVTRILKIVKAP